MIVLFYQFFDIFATKFRRISNCSLTYWCGSTHAFPFGEGGTAQAVTEEVLPQYEFAEGHQQNGILYRTSPAPFGGTLPKGEGFGCAINYNLKFSGIRLQKRQKTDRIGRSFIFTQIKDDIYG